VGRGAIHDAADGDQIGGAAGGGEDDGLQFRVGAGEVGDFLVGVGAAVVGEGDDAPAGSSADGEGGIRGGGGVRGGWLRCDCGGLREGCGLGGFVFVGTPGVDDQPGEEEQDEGRDAGADPEGTGGEGLVVGWGERAG
jgi:hypothetical protein